MNKSSTQWLAKWDRAKTGVGWCWFGVEAGVSFGERTTGISRLQEKIFQCQKPNYRNS